MNTKTEPENQQIIEAPFVEIVPFGSDDRIKLSAHIVRTMVAVPTRNGKLPDDAACMKFIMLCKSKHLNPFEGDAYMLGYDTQSGPQFSQITAHQVFLKRAEASPNFKGMESGVIVEVKPYQPKPDRSPNPELVPPNAITEREGDLVYKGETLLGGWARVHIKGRNVPFYKRLKLETFNTGRSRWEKDPAGMIVKCAEADALRSAFPTHLGGLFVQGELDEEMRLEYAKPVIERAKILKIKAPETSDEQFKRHQEDLVGSKLSSEEAGGHATDGSASQAPPPDQTLSGGEPQTAAPDVTHDPVVEPKVTPPAQKLSRKKKSKPNPAPVEQEMLLNLMNERLKVGGFTMDDLNKVCADNDWKLDLESFLHQDNWPAVQEALEDLKLKV